MSIYFYRAGSARRLILLSLILLISACTKPVVKTENNIDPQLAYEIRQERIRQISQWQLRARIAIKTVNEANTGGLYWQQQQRDVQIDLKGPFGVTVAKIDGNASQYRLKDRQGREWYAQDIEQLIFNRTGWLLPIARLRYWLLADTQNTYDADYVYNADGTLASLRYQQWHIDYQRYKEVNAIKLPAKITITHPDVSIKLSVREWQTQYD